jgi:predicted nucleic acid-binding protein
MNEIYVADTDAIIRYFHKIFGVSGGLSNRAISLIRQALRADTSEVKLSIPSVVFVEIFEKWFRDEEFARKLQYEVFEEILKSPNVEVKPIEQEVLEKLLTIGGNLSSHEINDKIIIASAMTLNCPIITTDSKIIEYVRNYGGIPPVVT